MVCYRAYSQWSHGMFLTPAAAPTYPPLVSMVCSYRASCCSSIGALLLSWNVAGLTPAAATYPLVSMVCSYRALLQLLPPHILLL